ncbi:MAG: 6-carboxytetrahydropterin synthase [Magnetococcales bacterium]|nr:6-carboxytetrahydropterin synthase [Magnetococcales bacterium]
MRGMRIARRFHFDAAHLLGYHDGKCRRLHGHAYRLELVLTGEPRPPRPTDPQSGFVADFGLLGAIVQGELIDPLLDHRHLNESLPSIPYTSTEYLAAWIMGWCLRHLEGRPELGGARMESVRVWESANAWAEALRADALTVDPA